VTPQKLTFKLEDLALPAAASPLPPRALRRDRRFRVDQPARVYTMGAHPGVWDARIRDVSRRGMQLTTGHPMAPGTLVRIEWNSSTIDGIIRSEQSVGGRYRLGVEVSSSWENLVGDVLARQAEELRTSNAVLSEQAEALQEQASLLDLSYDTILVIDQEGTVLYWNSGAERMYGWSKAEATGRNIHALLRTEFPREFISIKAELLAQGRWEGELTDFRRDGSQLVVASRWSLERIRGAANKVLVINSDITAQKMAEVERATHAEVLKRKNDELAVALETAHRAGEVKSHFLANVSHELRTPLNGIIGLSQLLHDEVVGNITGDQRECLCEILECSGQLLTLVNRILELTKIESGRLELEYRKVNLPMIVRETLNHLRPAAESKRISLEFEGDQPETIEADPERLKQVIYNYVSNAIKFSGPGGTVRVKIGPEDADRYRLEVRDTGVGIRGEDLPRLFAEFDRLAPSEKAQAGAGLGLPIALRIVEAHNGRVGVDSVFGEGSCFYAVLPIRRVGLLASPAGWTQAS